MNHLFSFWSMLFFVLPAWCLGQSSDRLSALASNLETLSQTHPQLNEPVQLSFEDVSLAHYVRALGQAHALNVYIEDTPTLRLTSDFQGESVKNVLLFLCKQFQYDFELTGSILSFSPYQPTLRLPLSKAAPDIAFAEGMLSADLQNDSLRAVIRILSTLTGRKILTKPEHFALLSAYLPPTPLDTALEAIFAANNLHLRKRPKGYYLVEPTNLANPTAQSTSPQGRTDFSIEVLTDASDILLTISAEQADLASLIQAIFLQTGVDYLQYTQLNGVVSLETELLPLDGLLNHLLQGTNYTYRRDGTLYLIGDKETPGMATTEIVHLRYRPTYQAIDLIPGTESIEQFDAGTRAMPSNPESQSYNTNDPYSTSNQSNSSPFGPISNSPSEVAPPPSIVKTQLGKVEIVEYPELNRIILKGPTAEVEEIAWFLHQIDQPVPVVKVEMLVLEVNQNRLLSTSVKAGRKQASDTLSLLETLIPNLNINAGGEQINNLLDQVPALSNLGVLSSDFYLKIRAQEERGNLKVEMQPVLSMLNGRSASLVVGQTQYYLLETQTSANGAVNNFTQFTQRFERIDANIKLSIRPYIAEDETVTLEVMPNFTTPIGSLDAEVPPTIATRRFESTIRVKNGETVILGGLTEERTNESTSGLPFLSRIPVLKYIFGSVDKGKTKTSMLIYLTPTIYYQ
ncbi:MAG: type II secretion system protein GspD [Bacteroidia bacterium]